VGRWGDLGRDWGRETGRNYASSCEPVREFGRSSEQGRELERDWGRRPGEGSLDASRDRGRRLSPARGHDRRDNEHGMERSRERSFERDWGARRGPQRADGKGWSIVYERGVYAHDQCSRIIGHGGQTIKGIERHSGCRLNLSPKPVGGEARTGNAATFSGTRAQVDRDIAMVEALLMAPDDKYMEEVLTEAFLTVGGRRAGPPRRPSRSPERPRRANRALPPLPPRGW